jgi:hypothetical protein
MPDSRNTVYWDPLLMADEQGKAFVRFRAPATPGKYPVVIKTVGSSGDHSGIGASFEVINSWNSED